MRICRRATLPKRCERRFRSSGLPGAQMADFPAFLTFEQVVDHVLRVMGLDESDILDLLNEHARAGNLHVTGKDAEFIDDVPHIFAQGQEFAQRQEILTPFFEQTVTVPVNPDEGWLIPYGVMLCEDGREVMFDHDYAPMYQRYPDQLPTRADPKEEVNPRRSKWLYEPTTPPAQRKRLQDNALRQWGVYEQVMAEIKAMKPIKPNYHQSGYPITEVRLITEVRHTYKIGKDALGECCVWRRLRDSWKDLGWTSIRFPREEIFRLWPLPAQAPLPMASPSTPVRPMALSAFRPLAPRSTGQAEAPRPSPISKLIPQLLRAAQDYLGAPEADIFGRKNFSVAATLMRSSPYASPRPDI